MRTARTFAVAVVLGLGAALGTALGAAAPAVAEPAREPAIASPWVEMHASRARLVASGGKTAAGAVLAGLEINLDDGWKTYWRMPGDAGVPPQLDWAGSENAASVKVLFPAPTRMEEAGGEVIGYKHAVLLPVAVMPQDPARPVALKLALEFGICREICVPATATFDIVIPPAGKAAAKDAAAEENGARDTIAAALERVPRPADSRRPSDPKLLRVGVEGEGSARLVVQAAFSGGKGGDVFVEAPEGLYVPMLRKETPAADGTVRFTADLSADLVHDLRGKALTLTLVSETGASEAQWTFP